MASDDGPSHVPDRQPLPTLYAPSTSPHRLPLSAPAPNAPPRHAPAQF